MNGNHAYTVGGNTTGLAANSISANAQMPAQVPPIESSMNSLHQVIDDVVREFDALTIRLTPIKNESPSQEKECISRNPSCPLEGQLMNAIDRLRILRNAINSTRDGLCI